MLGCFMDFAEFVENGGCHLQIVAGKEVFQDDLTLFLSLPTVAAENGLNLSLGLGRADEVHP